jgi:hypothetical protein
VRSRREIAGRREDEMTENERDELIGYWCVKCGAAAKSVKLILHDKDCPADSFFRAGVRTVKLQAARLESEP